MADSGKIGRKLLDAGLACCVLAAVWFLLLKPRIDRNQAEIQKQLAAPGNHSLEEVERAIGRRHDHTLKLPSPAVFHDAGGKPQAEQAAELLSAVLRATPKQIADPALRYAAWAEKQFAESERSFSIGYNEALPAAELKDYALACIENIGATRPAVLEALMTLTVDPRVDQYRILAAVVAEPSPEQRARALVSFFAFANANLKLRICDELEQLDRQTLLPAEAHCPANLHDIEARSKKLFIERRNSILVRLGEPTTAYSELQQMPVDEQVQLVKLFAREPETFRRSIPLFLFLLEKHEPTTEPAFSALRAAASQCRSNLLDFVEELRKLSASPDREIREWAISTLYSLGGLPEERAGELPQILLAAAPASRREIISSLSEAEPQADRMVRIFEQAFQASQLSLLTVEHPAYILAQALGALGESGEKVLVRNLTSTDPYLQAAAAEGLAVRDGPQSVTRTDAQKQIAEMLRAGGLKPWVKASFMLSAPQPLRFVDESPME